MRLFLISMATAFLMACGGGSDEPLPQQAMAAVQPKMQVIAPKTMIFPDIYWKVRLEFDSDQIIGFAPLPETVAAEALEVRWHSGGATAPANSPNAPRGVIQRDASGKLFAEVPMFYTGDRGIYVLAKRGFGTYAEVNGQPGGYMLVDQWQLPAGMTIVEIPGPTAPRRWLDWKQLQ